MENLYTMSVDLKYWDECHSGRVRHLMIIYMSKHTTRPLLDMVEDREILKSWTGSPEES